MKQLKLQIIALSIVVFIASCGNDKPETTNPKPETNIEHKTSNLKPLLWLCFKWEQDVNPEEVPAIFIETWKFENDSLLSGTGEEINPGLGRSFEESLRIFVSNDTVYYAPTVPDQNDGKEILFPLITDINSDTLIFENKKHDFPQTITYIKKSDSTLWVHLKGIQNGKPDEFSIDFIRETEN